MHESATKAAVPQKARHTTSTAVDEFMEAIVAKNPGEVEFHQAVREVVDSVMPVVESEPAYRKARTLERLVEPDPGLASATGCGREPARIALRADPEICVLEPADQP